MRSHRTILVAGVSCAGKSTFIAGPLRESLRAEGVQSAEIETHFGGKLIRRFDLLSNAPKLLRLGSKPVQIIHYNLLHLLQAEHETGELCPEDPFLQAILKTAPKCDVYVCYAPDRVIEDRMRTRVHVEPELAPSDMRYPNDRFAERFGMADQRKLVLDFALRVKPIANKIAVIFSDNAETRALSWEEFTISEISVKRERAVSASGV